LALAMGASVVAIEPQDDLATSLRQSVALNCAQDRVTVLHNALAVAAMPEGSRLVLGTPGFRSCGNTGPTQSGGNVTYVVLDDVLALSASWALLKVDFDADDAGAVGRVLELVRAGRVAVDSILVEYNNGRARGDVLHAFQTELGYDVYRLDVHDNRRFINSSGWDTISHFAPLPDLEPWFEERLQLRYMRYALKVKRLPSAEAWAPIVGWEMMPDFLITRVRLEEPQNIDDRKQPVRPSRAPLAAAGTTAPS
jgi:hypothetical protein